MSKPRITNKKAEALRLWIGDNPVRRLVVASVGPNAEWTSNESLVDATGANVATVNEVFRDLQKLRLGTFRLGRRGLPTRFEWAADPASVAAVARAEDDAPQKSKASKPPPMDEIVLESGKVVLVPKDMSQAELMDLVSRISSQALRHS